MYQIAESSRFKRDFKRVQKRGKSLSKLRRVVAMLQQGTPLPSRYRDHKLTGNYQDRRECHIEPDWLLIYKVYEEEKYIVFERTGSHADLF